jgi:hypothetical protein
MINNTNGVDYRVHNSNRNNLERGILERVFYVQKNGIFERPPEAIPLAYEQKLSKFKRLLCGLSAPTTRYTDEEFLSTYSGRKLTVYTNAIQSLRLRPFGIRDSYVNTFVKAEKVNFSSKSDPAPRVIQPRNPRYNVVIGKYIKKIEHTIYSNVAKVFGAPTIVKGMNAKEQGKVISDKWEKFVSPVAVGLDASRFDQHTGRQALEWEHSIYESFYPRDKRLKKWLSWQLQNKGYGDCEDGTLKYTVDGCRMSGDMNTGLGNCIIMCGLVWSYMQDKSIEFELLNNGDDCTLIFERKHLHLIHDLPEWFLQLGYTMKVEPPVYSMEQIEFCQTHPVFDGVQHVMVRDPRTCLTKDLITLKPVHVLPGLKFFEQAVADCGLAAYGNMPIFCEFYKQMDVGVRHKKRLDCELDGGLEWLSKGMNVGYSSPVDACRYSFFKAFGITPDEQCAIERYYASRKTLTFNPGPVDLYNKSPELYITTPIYVR